MNDLQVIAEAVKRAYDPALDLEEESYAYLLRGLLAEAGLAIVAISDDPLTEPPFDQAWKALQAEAALTDWGVSLYVLNQIADALLAHAFRIYAEQFAVLEISRDEEEDLVQSAQVENSGAL